MFFPLIALGAEESEVYDTALELCIDLSSDNELCEGLLKNEKLVQCIYEERNASFCIETFDSEDYDESSEQEADDKKIDDETLKLSINQRYNQFLNSNAQYLAISSRVDDLEIQEIIGNRGNCKINKITITENLAVKALPMQIKFGDVVEFMINCRNLLEIEIKTNLGNGIWKLN